MKYNLIERTTLFSKNIIDFVRLLPDTTINKSLILQLIRSSTSIGANYMEADCSISKNDFKYRISICRKEATETAYWLRLIAYANKKYSKQSVVLLQETTELILILSSIYRK